MLEEANVTHLVSHNKDVLLSFEFHYHRFQSDHNVTVRFAPCIMILPIKNSAFDNESGATNHDTDN